jgi:hypothetical protein
VVAYALLTLAVYVLTERLYGPRAANWSLVPLIFVSTDVLFWTSFPIGGHALVTFWHVAALLLLGRYLDSGKTSWLVALGGWSGLGYYTYQMFLFSLILIVPVAILGRAGPLRRRAGGLASVLFVASFFAGWSPHLIGRTVDSHDVYGTQTRAVWSVEWLKRSVPVLFRDCLPKFVAGPGQTGEGLPKPATIDEAARVAIAACWLAITFGYYRRVLATRTSAFFPRAVTGSSADAIGAVGQANRGICEPDRRASDSDANKTLRFLVAATPPMVLAGFVLHPAVDNHTHSRYLIYLMAWWPTAFGATLGGPQWSDPRRPGGTLLRAAAIAISVVFMVASATETYRYWRAREAVTRYGRPLVPPEDPVVEFLKTQDSFVYLYGWYWDVYRLTFLTGERVKGVPVQQFPDTSARLTWFDHLRIPEYADEARGVGQIGVVVRRAERARWRPPSGLRPVYRDNKYLVYVMPPPASP